VGGRGVERLRERERLGREPEREKKQAKGNSKRIKRHRNRNMEKPRYELIKRCR
jgi:hypothetical protein